ncbi:MAG: pterin-4a-carbinolamine dehydratase [Parcubacteria group bacterium Gr01-1014_70]|nr:MAG: pterin-4a-carbinolamine dehydratase [Parcubacteria group bacterium Gr01-1014_70]
MDELSRKKCKPCEEKTPPLSADEQEVFLKELPVGWRVIEGKKIEKEFSFADFVRAMAFVDMVADVAEGEGHHPDIHIHYNKVRIELWTHAIGGISENDFIVAAKIEQMKAGLMR